MRCLGIKNSGVTKMFVSSLPSDPSLLEVGNTVKLGGGGGG